MGAVPCAQPPDPPARARKDIARRQRPVPGRVPFRRDPRLEAGERVRHRRPATRAVRTSAGRVQPSVGRHRPLVVGRFGALPPDEFGRPDERLSSAAIAVSGGMPLASEVGADGFNVVRDRNLAPCAKGAPGSTAGAVIRRSSPDVIRPLGALPPDSASGAIGDLVGTDPTVTCRVPLRYQFAPTTHPLSRSFFCYRAFARRSLRAGHGASRAAEPPSCSGHSTFTSRRDRRHPHPMGHVVHVAAPSTHAQ
jgi:hypothetical protein